MRPSATGFATGDSSPVPDIQPGSRPQPARKERSIFGRILAGFARDRSGRSGLRFRPAIGRGHFYRIYQRNPRRIHRAAIPADRTPGVIDNRSRCRDRTIVRPPPGRARLGARKLTTASGDAIPLIDISLRKPPFDGRASRRRGHVCASNGTLEGWRCNGRCRGKCQNRPEHFQSHLPPPSLCRPIDPG